MHIKAVKQADVVNLLAHHYEHKVPIASRFYGALVDGELVGFVSLSTPTYASNARDVMTRGLGIERTRIARLSRIVVQPEHQNRGIGMSLVEHALRATDKDFVEVIARAHLKKWFIRMGFGTYVYTRKDGTLMVYGIRKAIFMCCGTLVLVGIVVRLTPDARDERD